MNLSTVEKVAAVSIGMLMDPDFGLLSVDVGDGG